MANRNSKGYKPEHKHYDKKDKCPSNKKPIRRDDTEEGGKLNPKDRDNNPNWYFTDKAMADQVTQMSFQQIAGLPLMIDGHNMVVGNYVTRFWNPSAGYSGGLVLSKLSAINLAGFRLFSKLAAYTGRKAEYGPQDISVMILAFGELITQIEWARRAFGAAFITSERNRSIPLHILDRMGIAGSDFYTNYNAYRTQFNKIVTLVNQLPIPKNVAYFDKCASMYEKLYVDELSPMATIIIDNPASSWYLDETSYSGGTILKTISWCIDKSTGARRATRTMGEWLSSIENYSLANLLNSSTLNVVYTDLLNLASKQNVEFWKFDYLQEGYMVVPEYNLNYALQFHNSTTTGFPHDVQSYVAGSVTPFNDVYPNPDVNTLQYLPAFPMHTSNDIKVPNLLDVALIDVLDPNIKVEDRVEVTRQISVFSGTWATVSGKEVYYAITPDHYQTQVEYYSVGDGTVSMIDGTVQGSYGYNLMGMLSQVANSAHQFISNPTSTNRYNLDGGVLGNLNYYTKVDKDYIERLHQFVGLALYDMR